MPRRGKTIPCPRPWPLALAGILLAGVILGYSSWAPSLAPKAAGAVPEQETIPASEGEPIRPNLLVITIDTLRADHVSAYGRDIVSTPNIDRLAREGARFDRALSHVPLTLPSHSSLFTGMSPLAHGVHNNGTFVLEDRFTTLAEVLREEDYETGAFVGAFPLDSRFGIHQGFDLYNDFYPERSNYSALTMAERPAPEVVEPAKEWIAEQQDDRWFCWIHLFDPHFPYQPPPPFDEQFAGDPYAGEVAYVDQVMGELFDFLRERGELDDTWIIFTSDHGEGRGDHNEKTHGTFAYNSTLWVPLIFRYPEAFAAETVIDERVRLADVMPTVLDYMNLPFPDEVEGTSLRPLLIGESRWKAEPMYFESMALAFNFNWAPVRGLYFDKYKYIDLPLPELYDTEADFDETQNLIESHPNVVAGMRHRFEEVVAEHSEGDGVVEPQPVDEETLRKLRALGYTAGTHTANVSAENEYSEEDDPKKLIRFINGLDDAGTLFTQGHIDEAIELYRELIAWRSDFALAYVYLAYVHRQQDDLAAAIELLETAFEKGLRNDMVLVRLGTYLQEAGQIDRAEAVLELAVESYPDHMEAWNALGMAYYRQGRREDAIQIFRELLEKDRSLVSAHNNLGSVYLGEGELERARVEFERALGFDDRTAEALNGLGVIHAKRGRGEEAIRVWKRAVELNPRLYDTLYNLGVLLTEQNRFDEAIEYLELFVENAPRSRYREDIPKVERLVSRLRSVS